MTKSTKTKLPKNMEAKEDDLPVLNDTTTDTTSETSSSSSEDNAIKKTKIEKVRKPYVLTEARKAAFEKARIARAENITRRKLVKEKETNEIVKFKEEKIKKKTMKEKLKEEQIAKLAESSSSEDEPIIVKKKKSKKKKIIYISDEEDVDNNNKGNIIIVNKLADSTKPVVKAQRKIPMFL